MEKSANGGSSLRRQRVRGERSATSSQEPDIANAAINGVTKPAIGDV